MANSALYFPYIDVPQTQWLFRTLLYWDTVKSIVPYDYVSDPAHHGPSMRELLSAGLVEPVIPGMYIPDIEHFGGRFLLYVERRKHEALRFKPDKLRQRDAQTILLHVEKLGRVGDQLVDLGLAERTGYPWFRVQAWVGRAFMAYLAAILGRQPGVEADPVTFDRSSLSVLGGSPHARVNRRMSRARTMLLRQLLPRPKAELDLHSIVRFKERHSESLRRFRSAVEMECIDIAQIDDEFLRQERVRLISEKLQAEIGEVSEAMRLQWKPVILGSLTAVLGGSLGLVLTPVDQLGVRIGAGVSLAGAIYQSLDPLRDRREALSTPLAYGAIAKREFGVR